MYTYDALRFTKLERGQIALLLKLKNESWLSTHSTTIANMEDQSRWFDSLDTDVHCPRNLILIANTVPHTSAPPESVGVFKMFNINYVNGSADVAWDVFEQFRGNGIGKRLVAGGVQFCLKVLGLRRLNAEILSFNEASVKCAKAAGFEHEGTKCDAVFKDGGYIDSLIFGLISKIR